MRVAAIFGCCGFYMGSVRIEREVIIYFGKLPTGRRISLVVLGDWGVGLVEGGANSSYPSDTRQ